MAVRANRWDASGFERKLLPSTQQIAGIMMNARNTSRVLLALTMALLGCDEEPECAEPNPNFDASSLISKPCLDTRPCTSDDDCAGFERTTVCGATCYDLEPKCVIPGTPGSSCVNHLDCYDLTSDVVHKGRCKRGTCGVASSGDQLGISGEDCLMETTPVVVDSSTGEQHPSVSCGLGDDLFGHVTVAFEESFHNFMWTFSFNLAALEDRKQAFTIPQFPTEVGQESFYEEKGPSLSASSVISSPTPEYRVFANYRGEDKVVCKEMTGTVNVLDFELDYFNPCGSSTGFINTIDGTIRLELEFIGVTCKEFYKGDGGPHVLQDGVYVFSGTRGVPNPQHSGPGLYGANQEEAARRREAERQNQGSGGGGSGSAACSAFSDATSYFGDIQYDAHCWQAGIARNCGLLVEADQTCAVLSEFLIATTSDQPVGDCPYCN